MATELSIIHIGAYKPVSYYLANVAIRSILEGEKKKHIIADYKQIINATSEPIFAKPFHPNLINDLLFDDLRIIIGIDLTIFFKDLRKYLE